MRRTWVSARWWIVGLVFVFGLVSCRNPERITALEALGRGAPALARAHPHGLVEGILGTPEEWSIEVWDPDRSDTSIYRIDADGSAHAVGTHAGAHQVVTIFDLSAAAMASTVIDSPYALDRANAQGGSAFTQRTGIKLFAMHLSGRNDRLVWTVQYGEPILTQPNRLTVVLDASTGDLWDP